MGDYNFIFCCTSFYSSFNELETSVVFLVNRPRPVKDIRAERRTDDRRITIRWARSRGADGYLLRWGVRPDQLFSTCEVYNNEIELGLFSSGQEYWFRVDAFNESGVTPGRRAIQR